MTQAPLCTYKTFDIFFFVFFNFIMNILDCRQCPPVQHLYLPHLHEDASIQTELDGLT